MYICKVTEQDQHIEILKEIATLQPGTFVLGKNENVKYHVKTTAIDIINAGKRLEELGVFAFNSKNDNEIVIKIVE